MSAMTQVNAHLSSAGEIAASTIREGRYDGVD